MRVVVDQLIDATPEEAQAAFLDPAFYQGLGQLEGISAPEVRSLSLEGGHARAVIGYRFAGELNSLARSVLDPAKLTWAQVTDVDIAAKHSEVVMVPDNYANLLSFQGWYDLLADDGGRARQHLEADLRVSIPLLGPLAERAIVSSIRENLASTASLIETFVAAQRSGPAPDHPTAPPERRRRHQEN
jgi:hypothetical protein